MCEAGRIRHHLRHVVEDPDNAIVIVSYQAEGTLGRQIAEGVERIQIMDQWYDLNAAVYVLDGFSGHADRNDLAWWFEQTGGRIEHGFLVHGEPESLDALAPVLQPHVQQPRPDPRAAGHLRGLTGAASELPVAAVGLTGAVARLEGVPAARSSAGRSATSADLRDDLGAGGFSASASRRTRALPTIRPSATGASARTCSGRLIPKPMQIGRSVWVRSQATFSASSAGRVVRSPVIPATET